MCTNNEKKMKKKQQSLMRICVLTFLSVVMLIFVSNLGAQGIGHPGLGDGTCDTGLCYWSDCSIHNNYSQCAFLSSEDSCDTWTSCP